MAGGNVGEVCGCGAAGGQGPGICEGTWVDMVEGFGEFGMGTGMAAPAGGKVRGSFERSETSVGAGLGEGSEVLDGDLAQLRCGGGAVDGMPQLERVGRAEIASDDELTPEAFIPEVGEEVIQVRLGGVRHGGRKVEGNPGWGHELEIGEMNGREVRRGGLPFRRIRRLASPNEWGRLCGRAEGGACVESDCAGWAGGWITRGCDICTRR